MFRAANVVGWSVEIVDIFVVGEILCSSSKSSWREKDIVKHAAPDRDRFGEGVGEGFAARCGVDNYTTKRVNFQSFWMSDVSRRFLKLRKRVDTYPPASPMMSRRCRFNLLALNRHSP